MVPVEASEAGAAAIKDMAKIASTNNIKDSGNSSIHFYILPPEATRTPQWW